MEDLESLMQTAVSDRKWQDVGQILKRNEITIELSAFALEEACRTAPRSERAQLIISATGRCQHGPLLSHLMAHDLWYVIDDVLQYGQLNTDEQKSVVEEASQLADDLNFFTCILPHCYEEQLPTILTVLVTRDCWQSVGGVLQKGVCADLTAWAVEKASKRAREEEFIYFFLPKCSGSALSTVLEELSQRNLMGAVNAVLNKIIGKRNKKRHFTNSGSQKGTEKHRETNVPTTLRAADSSCNEAKNDCCEFSQAIEQGDWDMIETLLQTEGAAVGEEVLYELSSLKNTHRLKIEREHPQPSVKCKANCSTPNKRAIQIAKIMYDNFEADIASTDKVALMKALQQCNGAIDSVIKARDRRLNEQSQYCLSDVGHCMQAIAQHHRADSVSSCLQQVLLAFTINDEQLTNLRSLFQHNDTTELFVSSLLEGMRICFYDRFGFQIPTNTTEELSNQLSNALESGMCSKLMVSLTQSDQELKSTPSLLYKCSELMNYLFGSAMPSRPQASNSSHKVNEDAQTSTCMRERQAQIEVNEIPKKTTVCEALEKKDEKWLTTPNLINCSADHLDAVLISQVKEGKWFEVAKILKQGVSEELHRWAVEEAWKRAAEADLLTFFVRDEWSLLLRDRVDDMIAHVVTRHMWLLCRSLLFQGKVSQSTRMWVIGEAIQKNAWHLIALLIPWFCPDDKTDIILKQVVENGRWDFVGCMIQHGASDETRKWSVEKAAQHAEEAVLVKQILCHCKPDEFTLILKELEMRGLEEAAGMVLQLMLSNILSKLASSTDTTTTELEDKVNVLKERISILRRQHARVSLSHAVRNLSESLSCDKTLADLLSLSFVDFINSNTKRDYNINSQFKQQLHETHTEILEAQEDIHMFVVKGSDQKQNCKKGAMREKVNDWNLKLSKASPVSRFKNPDQLQHFYLFFQSYFSTERTHETDRAVVSVLATVPLIPVVQHVALRIMLRLGRWDIISLASLTYVWENVRRELFQAAVKQRHWDVVKQWADHTLYDDQRGFALDESFKEQQWEVLMLLAEHGLDKTELNRVHYRLVNYADWDCVCKLLERGGDAAELIQFLRTGKKLRKATLEIQPPESKQQRGLKLTKVEEIVQVIPFNKAVLQRQWHAVLYQLRRRPSKEEIRSLFAAAKSDFTKKQLSAERIHRLGNIDKSILTDQPELSDAIRSQKRKDIAYALAAAQDSMAWHVVIQLVRLGMDPDQRDCLFTEMVRRHQWGVCRVLLEHGVTTKLLLASLRGLQNMRQWVLICRIMENSLEDSEVRQIMQHALKRREGSVVWQGMRLLSNKLSIRKRDYLFRKASSLDIWQAVKPLVEKEDSTGIKHRDTALLEAIESKQWDVLEHCQRHQGDVNMKNASGDNGLQTAAKKADWEAVEELMWHGGDQFQPDREGFTVLHRAAYAQQWDTVKLLVQFHGHLTKCDSYKNTPIQMLIDHCKADIIDEALFWGQNFNKGVNRVAETPLHAACAAGDYKTMYYLMARGMDPLCVTLSRQSVLMYAVMNKEYPEKMVAECIKLGLSTHQPAITDNAVWTAPQPWFRLASKEWRSGIVSPFKYAAVHGLPTVARMLYESGSCSYHELHKLYKEFRWKLTNIIAGQYVEAQGVQHVHETKDQIVHNIANFLDYVERIATTPRSLQSTCRIAISRQMKMSQRRRRHVQSLPLLHREQKAYVLFSDLTDPY